MQFVVLVMFLALGGIQGFATRPVIRKSRSLVKRSLSMMQPRALVPIAVGTEEIEAVTIIDTLVRGGVHVTVCSVTESAKKLDIVASRGVKLAGDCHISTVPEGETFDLIAVPGGMPGATHLRDSEQLIQILKSQNEQKRLIAAICAAPAVVLKHHAIIDEGVAATCYPAPAFTDALGSSLKESSVVVSDNIITSRGPGTALAFSLKLIELLVSKEKADEIAIQMLHGYET